MTANTIAAGPLSEWKAACEVQRRFMQHPGSSIDDVSYSARCRQVRDLGGDCYAFMPFRHNRLGLAVGDASGKGLPAALMISNVQSSLRTAALLTPNDPALALSAVNRVVYGSSLENRYATLFYGVFDISTHTLRYVNAGHNPPMVIRQDASIDWLETGGAPVGMFSDWSYEEGAIRLSPGDLLLAYTDGVIEAVNPAGEEWGVEELQRAAVEHRAGRAENVTRGVFAALDGFSHRSDHDDATVLALQVN